MAYVRNQPVAGDDLSISQPFLTNNTNGGDDSFGVDHYKFSDTTANNGFHNTVTTPLIVGSAHPTTAAAVPKFYAMQDSSPVGVIQYSRGPSNAVPSPVTFLQSQAAPLMIAASGGTSNILDFTGIARAMCDVYVINQDSGGIYSAGYFINWIGSPTNSFNIKNIFITSGGPALSVTSAGNVLKILNRGLTNANSVFWTVQFLRLS
jgi:hypothetical protein